MVDDSDKQLLEIKNDIVNHFTEENCLEVGVMLNCLDIVKEHDRLLRSLS